MKVSKEQKEAMFRDVEKAHPLVGRSFVSRDGTAHFDVGSVGDSKAYGWEERLSEDSEDTYTTFTWYALSELEDRSKWKPG